MAIAELQVQSIELGSADAALCRLLMHVSRRVRRLSGPWWVTRSAAERREGDHRRPEQQGREPRPAGDRGSPDQEADDVIRLRVASWLLGTYTSPGVSHFFGGVTATTPTAIKTTRPAFTTTPRRVDARQQDDLARPLLGRVDTVTSIPQASASANTSSVVFLSSVIGAVRGSVIPAAPYRFCVSASLEVLRGRRHQGSAAGRARPLAFAR